MMYPNPKETQGKKIPLPPELFGVQQCTTASVCPTRTDEATDDRAGSGKIIFDESKTKKLARKGGRAERNKQPRPSRSGVPPLTPFSSPRHSRQKSLNRAGLNAVYRVVCVIETWPSQSWIARVSTPSLASL
jgi:hypothetical protein